MHLQLLEEFESKLADVLPYTSNIIKKPVKLSAIQKTGRDFLFEDCSISEEALRDLLRILSIKNTLIDEINSDQDQWEPLHRCLTNIKNDKTITAFCDKSNLESKKIIRFTEPSLEQETALVFERGIDYLRSYLSTQNEKLKVQNILFNQHTLQLEFRFRNIQTTVDVFGDNNDLWSTGFCVILCEYKTQVLPYFLRLLCTNGMTATHMASQRYFENRDFKQNAFNKLLDKVVSKDLERIAVVNSLRLRENKASLREFYSARSILLEESKEIADAYFNETLIVEAYKDKKLKQKNNRWLSTANSNINSYDFFNSITHCVTHQKLNDSARVNLNTVASEIFFKGPDFSFKAHDPFALK